MNEYVKTLLIVCPLVFTAGFVDSIAGGGGLISLPAYLFAGLPAHMAAGTNKFASSMGTAVSSFNYVRAGKVNFSVALFSILGAALGSAAGSRLALWIPEEGLRLFLVVVLPVVGVFIVLQKDGEQKKKRYCNVNSGKDRFLSFLIGCIIGGYDGLAGPGTGTFLMLAFTGILGMEMVTASGCARVSNLASNISALVVYFLGGKVLLAVGLPAAACSIAGGFIGSRMAIRGGAKYIKKILYVVMILLFMKCISDFLL